MKKVTKPAQREEATYYSDFSGKCFGECPPPVELKIEFTYGSKHDGSVLELHLTDEEVKPILNLLKKNITEDYKSFMMQKINAYDEDYQTSCDSRDWSSCDSIGNSIDLLKELLDIEED